MNGYKFFWVCFLLFVAQVAFAQRNPPPVFESDYVLPGTATPMPVMPVVTEHAVSVIAYAVLLAVATLAVHRWRSRRVLFVVTLLSVGVLGFYLRGCPCPVGSIGSAVTAIVAPSIIAPLSVLILFAMPLLVALFAGRVFCSSVCPIGAVQEIFCLKPVHIPDWIDQTLGLVRHAFLGLAVLLAAEGMWFLICRTDPVVSLFRMSGMWDVLVFGLAVLIVGIWIGRPYCRYLCPYGVLLGWCSRLASRRVSVTPGDCSRCRLCETSCPYQAILPPTTPPTIDERRRGPWRLLAVIVAAPLIIAICAWGGSKCVPALARYHHDIILAERVAAERDGLVEPRGSFPETRAWLALGGSDAEAITRGAASYQRLAWGATLFGVWCGVVIVSRALALAVRRRRDGYQVDPARCVACGRCFWYCPNDRGGRVLID